MPSAVPTTLVWRIFYWALFAAFMFAAALNMLHVHAGFLTSYLADLVVPAWLYVNARGLKPGSPGSSLLRSTVGRTPERAALILFVASTLTEVSQIYWPHGLFAGRFDPYDILAYAFGVGVCYSAEKWLAHVHTPASAPS